MRRLVFLLLMTIFLADLQAQELPLYFERITTQNGLSHNKVTCLLQDRRGFMWIGTIDGLNRYDGKNFVRFVNKYDDTASISGNIITDIIEDRDGILWISTADGGITRYDYRLPPKQQFKQFKHLAGNPTSIPVNIINSLLEDPYGYLWLASSGHSVIRFNKKTEQFDELVPKGTSTVLTLCLDKNGIIWVGREGGGLLKINPKDLSVDQDNRYRNLYDTKLPHVTVTSLYSDGDKNIWFGSWDKVLYRYNFAVAREEAFARNNDSFSFPNDEIQCFAEDLQGRLWMGGKDKGLHIFDKVTNRFYNYSYEPSKEGTLADNRINCIYMDANKKIWIGTDKGLCINDPDRQQFTQIFLNTKEQNHQLIVYDFFQDDKDNTWIGTSEGLYIQQASDRSITHHPLTYKGNKLHITKIYKDDDGTIYLGTDYSLFVYDPLSDRLNVLPNTDKDLVMNHIIDSRIVSIIKDTIDGHPVLLVSPYGHFFAYYDLLTKQWISRMDTTQKIIKRFGLKDNLVRKFVKSKTGNIWLANGKGGLGYWSQNPLSPVTYYYNKPGDRFSIANNNIYDIAEDENNNLWIATFGGGLHFYNTITHQFSQIEASNNLIEGLQTDYKGNVWMISNGNLHKYDPRRNAYIHYDVPDIEKSGGLRGYIFKDNKGRLYVGGNNYFISFHPDSIHVQKSNPKVQLTDFSVFNTSYSHLLTKKEIELSYNDNYVTIGFAAPDFSPGRNVVYYYRLKGFDKDWVAAGTRNYASYSNLPGGNYTFLVRAANTNGVMNTEAASIDIVVIPPVWKRPWFYMVCAVFMALIIYAMYRYRINELLKRQAMRNKIAQDLHDNVGSTLSSISIYSQVAKIYGSREQKEDLQKTIEKISAASSEMISELNDTVWVINPRNDHMQVILHRMESFAKPLLALQNCAFEFTYDPAIITFNLDMGKRKDFYLIFKESVNNAVKYSCCTHLHVFIKKDGHDIIMKIRDDGKGFDLKSTSEGHKSSDVYGGGNGLKNMQLRAKAMKGTLKINSEPGKGTGIELKFPIT